MPLARRCTALILVFVDSTTLKRRDETIGGDAFEMTDQKVAEPFHFRQPLPAQGLDPAKEVTAVKESA
jgi:hypothetical protein